MHDELPALLPQTRTKRLIPADPVNNYVLGKHDKTGVSYTI